MKFAISILRMEEYRLQGTIEELMLKKEEVPQRVEAIQQREQFSHVIGLSSDRLKEVRDALKVLEK